MPPRPVRSLPSLLVLLLAAACAAPAGPAPADAGPAPAPAPGLGLAALREALAAAPAPGTRIEVVEWRELDASGGALAPLGEDAARPDTVAVAVHRRCRRPVGWLEAQEAARSSWYLLRDDALVAFDHPAFDAACRVRWHVRPTPEAERSVERALARYLAQRHPEGQPPLPEWVDRITARLDAGRDERAVDALESADREIARLRERLEAGGLDDETRLSHQDRLDALEAARARLIRTMRAQEVEGTPPEPLARPAREGSEAEKLLLAPDAPAPRSDPPAP